MVVLGLLVGPNNTPFDTAALNAMNRVLGPDPRWMLWFTWGIAMVALLFCAVVVALWQRRWRVAVAAALCPVLALLGSRALKKLFGRSKGDGDYWAHAYPSGHTTVVTTVTAMFVLAIGYTAWRAALAAVISVIGGIGMAATDYHYLTDIFGGWLWATALVCLAVLAAGPQAVSRAAALPAARPENTQPPKKVPSSER
ncbi:phosphatase PAP2 family protein [Mycolicibacterium fluoranthenivorans]|jgi:membrane-associated phospholipid phosphatase|uniref:PAP2 superfamily protein n=1 Tax=Mycolicibacterium fluoranthenivorans TaxID=258505 RepID=A0A1G4VJX2_9MYCO|nr:MULTISPECIES: phosphatase PAP2 family protein [Mycobacteriaceae]MCV7254111.1 phosphatase PAP2 family protein [Mycobacterium hackensackense]QNJ92711.1 phosphatase PAP2 family protein [Mycolicibacterium fluoranthenivorans]SCX07867.1 PAP2 superfamily protein [Mycolicibacterium fluoranthenivorans]